MHLRIGVVCLCVIGFGIRGAEAACVATGFQGLTAALVNPETVTGPVDATGCHIGVYFDTGTGRVDAAEIWGARNYGVVVNGDAAHVSVDVVASTIHDIGDAPLSGVQRGVAIYYRAFFEGAGSASGAISDNTIERYQKGGIVANGVGTDVRVTGNTVRGLGAVSFIAQNGIQVGYGANASVMRNDVDGNSYTGTSTVSGGIVVVGGAGYGLCPDGNACPYTTGTRIVQNTLTNNDVGLFLTNIDASGGAPPVATNVKATNNVISSSALQNNYAGVGYQAGVSDVGNNDKMIANEISGDGYDAAAYPSAFVVEVDADSSFTNRPKVHAND
jgi:hypothetical protein